MTLTDLSLGTATSAQTPPIGTSLTDLTRLTSAFARFLAAHPELPDLHCATVEYNPATVSWALDLLTADFDADGRKAVDAWGERPGHHRPPRKRARRRL